MTKHEAADLLDNLVGMIEDSENKYDDALKMGRDALKSGGWIPVTERLPTYCETFLVTRKKLGWATEINYGIPAYQDEVGWYGVSSEYDDYYVDDVIAWMPLPEPYKERTDDSES